LLPSGAIPFKPLWSLHFELNFCRLARLTTPAAAFLFVKKTPDNEPTITTVRSLVVAGNRAPQTVGFETDIVDFFVHAAELLGVPRSVAAIYGIVFASPVPLSFADIEARLDLSKGSVSQGLRTLREVGAIAEISKPTDATELFTPDLELRRLVGRYLASRLDPQLKSGRDRLGTLEVQLTSFPTAERKLLQPRLKKLQDWHARTRALLPVIKTFLKVT
jgi:DNA-binding transcriptional ArsR family regulator